MTNEVKKENEWKEVSENNEAWKFFDKEGNPIEENREFVGTFSSSQDDVGPNHSKLYDFRKDGEVISIWGSSVLDSRLKNVVKGEEVRIVYKGKVKNEKSGRSYHDFKVFTRKPAFVEVGEENIPIIEEKK